jgi:tetratricopeptide (TPR) repeat protein
MKEIVAEGEYVMGEGETPEVAAEKAKKNAVRHAAEQAGAFVKSYSKVRNLTLEDDVVEVVANHAMKITILAEEDTKVGKRAYRYYTKIKAVVSDEEIEANLKRIQEDRHLVEAYKKLQAEYNQQMKETEELKKKLAEATGNERKEVLVKIGTAEAIFKATLWYEQGERLIIGKEDQAIDAFTKAIQLNPKFSEAYLARAKKCLSAYRNISLIAMGGEVNKNAFFDSYKKAFSYLEKAIADVDSAIAINPAFVDAYRTRASAYNSLEYITMRVAGYVNSDDWSRTYGPNCIRYGIKGLEDYAQAIKLRPDDPDLYEERASAYDGAKFYIDEPKRYRFAAEDMSRAIDITTKDKKISKTHRLIKLKRCYMQRVIYYANAGMSSLEARDKETLKSLDKELLQILGNKQGVKKWVSSRSVDEELEWYRLLSNESTDEATSEQRVTTKIRKLESDEMWHVTGEKDEGPTTGDLIKEDKKERDELNKKIALNPEDPNNYFERARHHIFLIPRKNEEIIADYTAAIKLFIAKPEMYNGIRDKLTLTEAYAERASKYKETPWASRDDKFVRSPEKAVDDYTEAIKIVKSIQKAECAARGAPNIKSCKKSLEDKMEDRKNQGIKKICAALGVPNVKECKELYEKDTGKYEEDFKKCGALCEMIMTEDRKSGGNEYIIIKSISDMQDWLKYRAELYEELGRSRQALEDYSELCDIRMLLGLEGSSFFREDPCKAVQRLK